MVRALEPAGSGRAAAATAARQILRGGDRRAGQSADAHPGTRGRGGAAARGREACRTVGSGTRRGWEGHSGQRAPFPPREGSRAGNAAGLRSSGTPGT